MAYEIEKKFLVIELPPDLENYPKNEIMQGYLIVTENDIEIRIRKKGDRFSETVKAGSGLVRQESEKEITEEAFFDHWPLTKDKRIKKIRYDIEYGGKLIELDIYSGQLEGLVVAEVEFDSEEESGLFQPPQWFGEEVTHDERYKNKNLALHGKPSV